MYTTRKTALAVALALGAGGTTFAVNAETLTIATVNNGDMVRMQKLTDDFTEKNPDIELEWVTLEENQLRQRVTTDIATKGGQFDVMTIGTYEVPIWAEQGWLVALERPARGVRRRRHPARHPRRACRSTARCTPPRSTASPRWSCTART